MPDKQFHEILAFVKSIKDIDPESRRVRFVISSGEIDRDGERIEMFAVAAAIPGFSKNPTALACHQHRLASGDSPVIGSWDTASFKKLDDHCEMDLVFAKTTLGEQYWTLYRDGHMRAVSIGFRVQNERKETREGKLVNVIDAIELYEISCVPVGANRQSLAKVKEVLTGYYGDDNTPQKTAEPDAVEKLIDQKITELRVEIGSEFDDIRLLIMPDSDAYARELMLGSSGDSDASAGQTYTPEQIHQALTNTLKQLQE